MYKYQTLKIGKSSLDVELNKMGSNGWKAVFFENTGDGKYRVIFEYDCSEIYECNDENFEINVKDIIQSVE